MISGFRFKHTYLFKVTALSATVLFIHPVFIYLGGVHPVLLLLFLNLELQGCSDVSENPQHLLLSPLEGVSSIEASACEQAHTRR